MSKAVGFPGSNRIQVYNGRQIETESLENAKRNPGTLTRLQDITKKQGESFSENSSSEEESNPPTISQREEVKAPTVRTGRRVSILNKEELEVVPTKREVETQENRVKTAFKKRKFERFCDPPRWVMIERTFDTNRHLRARKLFLEDYSSSSEDEGYWGRDVEPILSHDESYEYE